MLPVPTVFQSSYSTFLHLWFPGSPLHTQFYPHNFTEKPLRDKFLIIPRSPLKLGGKPPWPNPWTPYVWKMGTMWVMPGPAASSSSSLASWTMSAVLLGAWMADLAETLKHPFVRMLPWGCLPKAVFQRNLTLCTLETVKGCVWPIPEIPSIHTYNCPDKKCCIYF